MWKLHVAAFVALLMAGSGVGDSGPDGPESNQPTADVAKVEGKPVKEENSGKKPFTIPGLSMEMLWCKPGTFTMGSPKSEKHRDDDETQHAVTLTEGFWLGKHEVTQAQWKSIMGTNPSWFKGADLPVETVAWHDATSFCEKLTQRERKAGRLPAGMSYQLPTEAQWEYACRAGTSTRFYYGDDPGYTQLGKYAWYRDNSLRTHPVGLKLPNAWGLHDMYGNVWEWCMDWYSSSYPGGSVNDPKGATRARGRVFRGGSWSYNAVSCRSAYRSRSNPTIRINSIGFRVVLAPVQ